MIAPPEIYNCTITENEGGTGPSAGVTCIDTPAVLTNCVIYGNCTVLDDVAVLAGDDPIITYSDIDGGWTGTGNIDKDPLFVSAGSDYHLQDDSPCIDVGTTLAGVTDDLEGTSRPQGDEYDMGCYERAPVPTPDPTPVPTPDPTPVPMPDPIPDGTERPTSTYTHPVIPKPYTVNYGR